MRDANTLHYLPILTTLISAIFSTVLFRAAITRKSGPHLWWWAFGVAAYGLGTLIEATITLSGNSVFLTKAWYIAGALLGGYPLAQGVAWLLMPREKARRLTLITVPFLILAAIFVWLSPVDLSHLEAQRPTGSILVWHWVRLLTPFLNLYAFVILVGGAFASVRYYRKTGTNPERVMGNILIGVGGILPGIGGSMAKAGIVEALYVGELMGIILIWIGYGVIATRKSMRAQSQAA